jgi:hypothetical protein
MVLQARFDAEMAAGVALDGGVSETLLSPYQEVAL